MSKLAFLVGITEYENRTRLGAAVADSKAVERALRDVCLFDEVDLLTCDDDEPPTADRIVVALTKYTQNRKRYDTFLFYFAGHGFVSEEDTYLLGINAPEAAEHIAAIRGISLSRLGAIIDDIHASQKVVICDCCRSSLRSASSTEQSQLLRPEMYSTFSKFVRAQAMLLSCAVGENSYEREAGVFTDALVRGISRAAAGTDGVITMNAISAFVADELQVWSNKNTEYRMTAQHYESGLVTLARLEKSIPHDLEITEDRKRMLGRVDALEGKGHLIDARGELLQLEPLTSTENVWLQALRSKIKEANPYTFSDGTSAVTLADWISHLVRKCKSPAKEVENNKNLEEWLRVIHERADLAQIAGELRKSTDGLWTWLQRLINRANESEANLVDEVKARAKEVEKLLNEGREHINAKRLDLALESLHSVQQMDPHSPQVFAALKRASELRAQLVSAQRASGWETQIDEGFALLRKDEFAAGITRLELAHKIKVIPFAILKRLNDQARTFPDSPEIRLEEGIEYVRFPPSAFLLEYPVHMRPPDHRVVALSKDFWISRRPITVGEYKRVMRGSLAVPPKNNPNWVGLEKPMVRIDRHQALDFCTKSQGNLPTEAQWHCAVNVAPPGWLTRLELAEWCLDGFRETPQKTPVLDPVEPLSKGPEILGLARQATGQIGMPLRMPCRLDRKADDLGFRCVRVY